MNYRNSSMINFHGSGANARMLDSLKESQQGNKESKEIYESVFMKHFQIIQTFLQKINQLYNKHDEFEHAMGALGEKVEKLEINTKNIHYEFRTTHLMLDKKLNTMNTDYNNLQEQLRAMHLDLPFDSYLSSSHFLAKSSNLRSRNKKKKSRRNESENYKIEVHSNQNLNLGQVFTAEQEIEEEIRNDKMMGLGFKGQGVDIGNRQRAGVLREKLVSFDNLSSQSEVRLDCPDDVSMIVNPDFKQVDENEGEQEQELRRVDEQLLKSEIKKQSEILGQRIEQQVKKLADLNLSLRQQFSGKIAVLVKMQQLNSFQRRLQNMIGDALARIKGELQMETAVHKEQLLQYNQQLMKNFQEFDSKLLQKVDMVFFEESLNNLGAALSEQFAKQDKYYSNKVETKRALDFLERKINRFIAEEQSMKSKKQFAGNDDPCLKINKCQSIKRLDWTSEKSIRDKADENYRSLETSMKDIEYTEKHITWKSDNKLKRVISNIINWKTPPAKATPPEETKMFRSTTKAKEPLRESASPSLHLSKSKRLSMHGNGVQPQVNVREWREKVVKILKKEDRRKRKVTFR